MYSTKDKTTVQIKKVGSRAEIFMVDGTHVVGEIPLPGSGRIQDTLNDSRNFIPFKLTEGPDENSWFLLNKACIIKIRVID